MNRTSDVSARLRSLAGEVAWPETPDLVPGVRTAIAEAPAPGTRRFPRLVLASAAVLAVVLAGTLVFAPGVRTAVARWLGIEGVRIETTPGPGTTGVTPGSPELGLGTEVDLATARASVDHTVRLPEDLGAPDRVYLDREVPGGKVSLVYDRAGSELPIVIGQFPGSLERAAITKSVDFGATSIDIVEVRGATGYWISGGAHEVAYVAPDGTVRMDSQRYAANTLLWHSEGVTYRIETEAGLRMALRLARSL